MIEIADYIKRKIVESFQSLKIHISFTSAASSCLNEVFWSDIQFDNNEPVISTILIKRCTYDLLCFE